MTEQKSLPSLKSEEKESEIQSEFDTYTDELFEEEVTLNTIALHYTLADPAAYGINDYEISLGSVTDESLSDHIEDSFYNNIIFYLAVWNQITKYNSKNST